MKAIRIHSYGDSDQIHLEEAPHPVPGSGEVTVRVRRAGVNPVDWKIRLGAFGRSANDAFPLTLGQDFAGEVADGDATRFHVGDRVLGFAAGAYAEFATAAEADLARMPETMSFETAAALPTPGVTAFQLIGSAVGLQPGQSLLVHGGAGAVGSIVVQLARQRGATVAATALNDRDCAYLRELGVATAINNTCERFEERVRDLDAVIDLVGGEFQPRSLAVLKPGGLLVTTVGGLEASDLQAESRRLGIRTLNFRMARSGADLAELVHLAERGLLHLRAVRVLPFEQARQAQDISERGEAVGQVVLRVA